MVRRLDFRLPASITIVSGNCKNFEMALSIHLGQIATKRCEYWSVKDLLSLM